MFPYLLDPPKTMRKNPKNDFLKVYNEFGKIKKFRTSRPFFSWRNSLLKKVQALCTIGQIDLLSATLDKKNSFPHLQLQLQVEKNHTDIQFRPPLVT